MPPTPPPLPSDPGRFLTSETANLGQADSSDPACPFFSVAPSLDQEPDGRAMMLDGISRFETGEPRMTHRFSAGQLHVLQGQPEGYAAALLSVLSLTVQPVRGAVFWGDLNLTLCTPAQQADWRRRQLGLVSEAGRLVAVMSVRDHVRLAAAVRGRPDAEAEGLAMLGALGMGALFNHLPDQLTSSEKQCLALAQSLSARPPVLLADQPTAALNDKCAALVATTLRTYARDRGAVVICASHDPLVLNAADEVLQLG